MRTRGVLSHAAQVSESNYFLTLAHTYYPSRYVVALKSQRVVLATREARPLFLLRDYADRTATISQEVNLKPLRSILLLERSCSVLELWLANLFLSSLGFEQGGRAVRVGRLTVLK